MEVILIENIEKLGKVGDIVKVKDGYARNYLIPKKKVLRANKENLKVFEEKKSSIEAEENKRKEKSEEIAKKIQGLEILIIRNAAENGQLYGSVTSKDIVKEIFLLNKIQFINEQINLKKTLKSIGVFEVEISVYTNLKAKILVSIAKTKELGLEQIKRLFENEVLFLGDLISNNGGSVSIIKLNDFSAANPILSFALTVNVYEPSEKFEISNPSVGRSIFIPSSK